VGRDGVLVVEHSAGRSRAAVGLYCMWVSAFCIHSPLIIGMDGGCTFVDMFGDVTPPFIEFTNVCAPCTTVRNNCSNCMFVFQHIFCEYEY
jgi:hypothetical protein